MSDIDDLLNTCISTES